tara:strand:- start:931 stop:1389 length:459 start_codon:yes stop_codon:yes gene_type:complete
MIKIKDNFLDEEVIHDLEYCMLGSNFAWFIAENKLTHHFWNEHHFSSRYNDICRSWIDMYIKPTALIKVQGDLYFKTQRVKKLKIDSKHKNSKISILYINNNNGCTKFKDGTVVQSVRNRMITFPANLTYTENTCTNDRFRCIINMNYYNEV